MGGSGEGRREEWAGMGKERERAGVGEEEEHTEGEHHLIAGEGEALYRAEDLEDIHSG